MENSSETSEISNNLRDKSLVYYELGIFIIIFKSIFNN